MFDIMNPQISVVAKGLEGKVIMIYGSNNLGKTLQATRMKKPLYLPFEKGLSAISGVPFMPINKWADFKKVNKQLTDVKTLEQVKEKYSTIIFDEVEASARYCQRYISNKYGADSIKTGNDGFGLWKEYEMEFWEEINKLLGVGFTVVFIAHQTEGKDGKVRPKGDKRALEPIVDNCDVVVHLQSNGIDETGKVIKSSGYLAESVDYFARSRFDYIDTYIAEFTAENLEKTIIEAIERQEREEGITAVDYSEQQDTYKTEELDYDKLMEDMVAEGGKLHSNGCADILVEIVEKHLGKGAKVTECNKYQVEVMSVILDEIKSKIDELGL